MVVGDESLERISHDQDGLCDVDLVHNETPGKPEGKNTQTNRILQFAFAARETFAIWFLTIKEES